MRGAREPKYKLVPERVSTGGSEAVDLMASCGVMMDPWQGDILDVGLGEAADGRLSAKEVAVVVPRQNGKSAIFVALILYWMFLADIPLILYSAHEFKTAREIFLRVAALVKSSPHLMRQVKAIRTANGEEGVELKNGNRIRFVARSKGSGRGFTPHRVILDEAYELPDAAVAALMPSLSAVPDPQIWYGASAPHETSTVLRRVCKRGRTGTAERLAYFEWMADEKAQSGDPNAWAEANPALGYRVSLEWVETELDAMDDDDFRRERLGVWDEQVIDSTVDTTQWAALATSARLAESARVAFAVDVSPDRSTAAIAACGLDGTVPLTDVVTAQNGTGWVVPKLRQLIEDHSPCVVVMDARSPAASLLPKLAEMGIRSGSDPDPDEGVWIATTGAAEMASACGDFYDAIVQGRLAHLDQPKLNDAVATATTRSLGDAWAWSRKRSTGDITPLVAATLAHYGLAVWGPEPEPEVEEVSPFVLVG